jgi:hypothetical protein
MGSRVKQKLWFTSQNNGKTQRIVAPLFRRVYCAVNLLMEIKQMVAVSPVCNALRQRGLISSVSSLAKLFNSRGSNRKYSGKTEVAVTGVLEERYSTAKGPKFI